MTRLLTDRRQFGTHCAALGASLPAANVLMAGAARADSTNAAPRTVTFADGRTVPALGQGSWHLAQQRHPLLVEEQAMRTGMALGMTLIDTSGNYGDGATEQMIGDVVASQRDHVFLVSKVEADTVTGDGAEGMARACEASLKRLRTDYLDLYLLHSAIPDSLLPGAVAKFEQLRAAGKIHAWGVSNFTVERMEELMRVPGGDRCATNQVRYSLRYPYFEKDILPWCAKRKMPVMATSPLGGADDLLVADRTLAEIGAKHGCSAAAIALSWAMRSGNVIAIPESGLPAHIKENAVALSL